MKRYYPLLLFILFVAAEELTKGYFEYSLRLGPIYHQILLPASILLVVSAALLFIFLQKSSNAAAWWDSFTAADSISRRRMWIVVCIIVLGCTLRLMKLGSLVSGMTFDEAYKGLDGIAIRQFGERPIFLDWNVGREALVAYLVAFSQNFSDYSIVSVRIITALAGCLSLIFFYLLAKTLFNNNVAVLATFLMTVSKYHIIHSRYGVRAGQFVVFELAALYFLARGFMAQNRNPGKFLIAGAISGTGFYTYIAYRIFPLIGLAFTLQKEFRKKILQHWIAILAGLLIAAAILSPLAVYFVQHRESFTGRMKRTAVWEQKGKSENVSASKLIYDATVHTLGMFTFNGDSIARHNVNGEPMLSAFASPFFLLGILLTFLNIRKRYAVFLLFYFVIGILPGILSVHAPNSPRTLASIPPAMLFTAFGIIGAYQLIRQYQKVVAFGFLALVLAGNFFTGINDALIRYPAQLDSLSPKLSALWGMDRDQTAITDLANSLGSQIEVYLTPQNFFHSTVEYLTYTKTPHKLYTFETNIVQGESDRSVAVVILQLNRINSWWLRDDEGKKFFKWWQQYYGMNVQKIHSINEISYDRYLTNISDRKLYRALKMRYPNGKELNFRTFSAYVISRH